MFSSHYSGVSEWVFVDRLAAFADLCILILGMIYSCAIDLVSGDDLLA